MSLKAYSLIYTVLTNLYSSVYNLVFYLSDGIPKFIHSGWSELVLMGISSIYNFVFKVRWNRKILFIAVVIFLKFMLISCELVFI
jgi:hypothetical protein